MYPSTAAESVLPWMAASAGRPARTNDVTAMAISRTTRPAVMARNGAVNARSAVTSFATEADSWNWVIAVASLSGVSAAPSWVGGAFTNKA